MTTVLVTLLAVVIALGVILVVGVRRAAPHPHLNRRRESLAATDIEGKKPDGGRASIPITAAASLTMLVFLTSTCTACVGLWNTFEDLGRRVLDHARLVMVTKGEDAESSTRLRRLTSTGMTVVMSTEAWDAYDVVGGPYFALVEGGAVVDKGVATTWEPIVAACERRARVL